MNTDLTSSFKVLHLLLNRPNVEPEQNRCKEMIPIRYSEPSGLGFSSECSVTVSVPLPTLPRSRLAEAGLVEILLEDWLLRPLQTLASIRPTAELYRLKRKIMDSPFMRKKDSH